MRCEWRCSQVAWEYKHLRKHHEFSMPSGIHSFITRRSLNILLSLKGRNIFIKPVIKNPMLQWKNWHEYNKEFQFNAFCTLETYLRHYKWGKVTVSQVLAGQACLSPLLEGDQKIKYDNIKLISIVLSCPKEIQYLELYSLLIKPLTNLILILYLPSQMKIPFWLCNFFVLTQIRWQVPAAEKSLQSSLTFTI